MGCSLAFLRRARRGRVGAGWGKPRVFSAFGTGMRQTVASIFSQAAWRTGARNQAYARSIATYYNRWRPLHLVERRIPYPRRLWKRKLLECSDGLRSSRRPRRRALVLRVIATELAVVTAPTLGRPPGNAAGLDPPRRSLKDPGSEVAARPAGCCHSCRHPCEMTRPSRSLGATRRRERPRLRHRRHRSGDAWRST